MIRVDTTCCVVTVDTACCVFTVDKTYSWEV
jgi:hypothetical protein